MTLDANANAGTSAVTDHPFQPRGEWFTPCAVCGLAEAAHTNSTLIGWPEGLPARPPADWRPDGEGQR